ncbi:MAG: FHA domain-containing protein [Bacteroidetes bacterium]|nr:FHA domain-containing protein [Bacteroidota bacterium]
MSTVVYLLETDTGRRHRIDEGMELMIGRSIDSHIVIDNSSISRHHASVGIRNGQAFVRDAGSTNGTLVNGERIGAKELRALNLTDEFVVGNFTFRILDEEGIRTLNFKNKKKPGDTSIMSPGH